MSNPSSFIDVHTFDGSLSHNIKNRFTLEEKCVMFNWLIVQINTISSLDCDSITGLKLVIENTQHSNFDSKNNVYADDILVEICAKLIDVKENERISILKNIAEQMSDMYRLGQCPQGRTTRLIQIYNAME